MSTPTPAPIGNPVSPVLPPSVVKSTSIDALARVGTKHKVFETASAPAPAPVMEDADGEDDYSVPMVMPGLPTPGVAKKSAPAPGLSEDDDGSVLGDYARVAAAGNAPAPTTKPAAPKKHSVNERVMTLGELIAERTRNRDQAPAPVMESEHTGLSTLRAMFPKR